MYLTTFNRLKKITLPRLTSQLAGVLAILALAGTLCGQSVHADESSINSILGDPSTATAQKTPGTPDESRQTTPQTVLPKSTHQKEVWVKSKKPLDHLHIIGAHPLPGENCQQVIFDAHPSVKTRHLAKPGKSATFKIERLCLMGLRNGSDDRSLVIRMGESFETLAISPDPELFTGMVIAPHQQVMIPIRPLRVGILDIRVEVTFKSDLDKANPTINTTTITMIGKK